MQLKKYQEKILFSLEEYLNDAKVYSPEKAYNDYFAKYPQKDFHPKYKIIKEVGDAPYVCIRVPTGGGKTILGVYSIKVAIKNYIYKDYPVVLWLVPTNIIRTQTLKAFLDTNHPYHKALSEELEGKFNIYDISDMHRIRPIDYQTKVCIILGTFASIRVDKTEGRNFYRSNENLEPHFQVFPKNVAGLEYEEDGEREDQVKYSNANVLKILQPLVIVDEAHNARTKLTYEVFERIKPSCILEYTATPDYKTSNVLCRISAEELKTEDMIKLPIVLTGHPSWQESIHHAVGERNKLEQIASEDIDYIRPILLIQAEHKNSEKNVDVIKKFLLENEKIDPDTIAIETGDIKELEGIDLFNRNCKIRIIITMQALKEGWDCSFAYVFCSVANIYSNKDVEQLLGRVLRMPYTKKRERLELNKAYAHVSSPNFIHAANEVETVLKNMGFEKEEIKDNIEPGLFENFDDELFQTNQSSEIILDEKLELTNFSEEEKNIVTLKNLENGKVSIVLEDVVPNNLKEKILNQVPEEKRKNVNEKINSHNLKIKSNISPAKKGEVFALPLLSLNYNGRWELLDKELLSEIQPWDLSKEPAELDENEFSAQFDIKVGEIDFQNQKIVTSFKDSNKDNLELDIKYNEDINSLARWLDKTIFQEDINQITMLDYCRRTVSYLVNIRNIEISKLVLLKFLLARALKEKITKLKVKGAKKSFDVLFHDYKTEVIVNFEYEFKFEPNIYPLTKRDNHSYHFQKHFYGSDRIQAFDSEEEFECAKAIDSHDKITYWIRNTTDRKYSFSLPTSSGHFFPDFVCKLIDEKILVIEYKGAHLEGNLEEQEKKIIGELWEEKSNGKCLFLWVSKKISKDLFIQIYNKLK